MKIIWTDGFDHDFIADRIVAENVPVHEGRIMEKALQVQCEDADWYRLVPDDYKLKLREP